MDLLVQNPIKKKLSSVAKHPTRQEAEQAIHTLLLWAGDNPSREGLIKTPERVAKAYSELFGGYSQSAEDILGTVFEEVAGYKDPIVVRDIEFFSHCEHHMVPIIGKAHIAYLPDNCVVGLSKLPRVVEVFARRLQTQETMTAQIADAINNNLKPRGVAVLIEAEHLCMAMRGVKKQGSTTITIAFRGHYEDNPQEQAQFMNMIRGFK